jgi:hypothetical protein
LNGVIRTTIVIIGVVAARIRRSAQSDGYACQHLVERKKILGLIEPGWLKYSLCPIVTMRCKQIKWFSITIFIIYIMRKIGRVRQ